MSFRYGTADPVRLEVTRFDSTIVAAGEPTEQIERSRVQLFLTVSTQPVGRDSTHLIFFDLDSLRRREGLATADSTGSDPLAGLRWTASRDPSGRLRDLRVNRVGEEVEQLEPSIRLLYPLLPDSAFSPGRTWADSTTYPVTMSRFRGQEILRSTYLADTLLTQDDRTVLPIRVESVYSRSGQSEQGGQLLKLEGVGIRSTVYYLYIDETAAISSGVDTTSLTIVIPATGARVPAQQIGRFQVRLLPSP